jgi:hypothetical protein
MRASKKPLPPRKHKTVALIWQVSDAALCSPQRLKARKGTNAWIPDTLFSPTGNQIPIAFRALPRRRFNAGTQRFPKSA